MILEDVLAWLQQGQRRVRVILALRQPMTATQLSRRAKISRDACGKALWELRIYEVVECLNSAALCSRIYWLTALGMLCRKRLTHDPDADSPSFPEVDWDLYGSVCFRHRSTVIKTLREPMQPAEIKRQASRKDPQLRMSANNVRDVMRYLKARGVVEPRKIGRKKHPRYVLTETGQKLQELLLKAEEIV